MTEPQQPQQPNSPETQMAPQQPVPPPVPQQPGQPGQPAYPAQPGYAAPQQPYPPQYAAPQQGYPPQPGYAAAPPVQPGYPPQFPGLPPGSAVPTPPGGSNFSSGKGKTIGLIVAGVVAVGALGGIGALVFGGGGDDEDKPSASSDQNSGILDPKPVGSASPAPTEPTDPAEPTEPAEPTPTPTPEPEPEPEPEPPSGGGLVTLPGNGLQVFVPPGWEAGDPGQFAVQLIDGEGAYAFVLTGQGDPALESGSLIQQNLDAMLPPSSYTYELSNPQPANPSGSIVSVASVDYDGTYVDSQSSLPVTGRIFGAVRSDGAGMLILIEHGSIDDYNASGDAFNALLNETFALFGGS